MNPALTHIDTRAQLESLILAFVSNFWEYFFFLNQGQAIDYFYERFCNILLRVNWEHCCEKIVFCLYILDTYVQERMIQVAVLD